MSDYRKGVLLAAIAISLLLAAAIGMRRAEAAPIEHVQSWQEAVYLGTIEGDPEA